MHDSAPQPAPRLHPPAATNAARQTRKYWRLQTVRIVFASYLIDCLMLFGLSLAGGLALQVPVLYLAAGALVSGFFHVLLSSGFSDRFSDHYLAGPQMLAHAVVNIGFTWHAPEIGVLLMMVLFILLAIGSLRVKAERVLSLPLLASFLVGAGVITTIVVIGDRLSMPTATWQERALCGLWVAFVLSRSTMVGIYSARLRSLLNKRNEELATTFEKLELLATRDELTGTLNRRSVMRLLDDERQRMERTGQPFGVALFDLDHFKQVNDGYGHLTGDETLRHFTRTATASMRTTDRLGRYGGEEFLLLLTATTDETAARTAAERVRESTAEHNWAEVAPGLKVTVSAGVALCRPGETAEQLLDRADHALYEAKRSGRNRVAVADATPA